MLVDILERLQRHRQAATYGAIAGVVGGSHRRLMANQDRSHRSSWVVNRRTRRPTGYGREDFHPDLLLAIEARGILKTPADLAKWLKGHP